MARAVLRSGLHSGYAAVRVETKPGPVARILATRREPFDMVIGRSLRHRRFCQVQVQMRSARVAPFCMGHRSRMRDETPDHECDREKHAHGLMNTAKHAPKRAFASRKVKLLCQVIGKLPRLASFRSRCGHSHRVRGGAPTWAVFGTAPWLAHRDVSARESHFSLAGFVTALGRLGS